MLNLRSLVKAEIDKSSTLILPQAVNFIYIQTDQDAKEALKAITPYSSDKNSVIGVDFETDGLDPYVSNIHLLQIGLDTDIQYIFDMRTVSYDLVKPVLAGEAKKLGQNLKFEGKFIKVKFGINFTNLYDTQLAEQVIRGGSFFKSGGGYSLDAIISRHFDVELKIETKVKSHKDEERAKKMMQLSFLDLKDGTVSEAQLAYAAFDVSGLMFDLKFSQEKLLNLKGKSSIYCRDAADQTYNKFMHQTMCLKDTAELEFKFLENVIDIETGGIGFCVDTHKKVMADLEVEHDSLKKEFLGLLGEKCRQKTLFGGAAVNPDSAFQLLKHFNAIEIDVEDTAYETVEAQIRSTIKGDYDHRLLTKLIQYRSTSTLLNNYDSDLLGAIHPTTNRLHYEISQIKDTGRISVKKPNIQKIPALIEWMDSVNKKDIRACFVPAPGYKLIVSDYNMQELRIAACIANERMMLKAFAEGKDVHVFSASLMYGTSYEALYAAYKAGDPEAVYKRKAAKTVSFGVLYGSGPGNLASILGISFEKAKEIIKAFWDAYPNLQEALKAFGEQAYRLGYSNTVLGRRRYYRDILGKIKGVEVETSLIKMQEKITDLKMKWLEEEFPITPETLEHFKKKVIFRYKGEISRAAANMPIQGTAGDSMKLASILMRQEFQRINMDAKIVGLIHDEAIIEVRDDQAEECAILVSSKMTQAMEFLCPIVEGKTDTHIRGFWQK